MSCRRLFLMLLFMLLLMARHGTGISRNDGGLGKANDDLKQEQFVSHLVAVFDHIFIDANLGARLRPYEIMATSPRAGLIEVNDGVATTLGWAR